MRSCSARTTALTPRRLEVSNGRWVASRCTSVASAASRWRSRLVVSPDAPPSMSRVQARVSAIQRSIRAASAGATPWGKTTMCTTVAQPMPSRISSTRAKAMSKTPAGALTAAKPMMAAV